jgi:hypothetical protein
MWKVFTRRTCASDFFYKNSNGIVFRNQKSLGNYIPLSHIKKHGQKDKTKRSQTMNVEEQNNYQRMKNKQNEEQIPDRHRMHPKDDTFKQYYSRFAP